MKTTLVSANQLSFDSIIPLYECIGILTLASILKKEMLEVDIVDLARDSLKLKEGYDLAFDSFSDKILNTKPDVVAISSMPSTLPFAIILCQWIKDKNKDIITILGGSGSSFQADKIILNFPDINFVMRGEAENSFPLFLKELENHKNINHNFNIDGLVYKINNKIIDNGWPDAVKNLDNYPIPLYELCEPHSDGGINLGRYNSIGVENGRGCVYKCTFCSSSYFFNRNNRLKSVDRVLQEIKKAVSYIGIKDIMFHHDIMTYDKPYINELCVKLKEQLPEITWSCNTRLDAIDNELVKTMYDSGCREIFIGVEGTTENIQNIVGKKVDLVKMEEIINSMYEAGYKRFCLSCIIGIPGTTKQDIHSFFSLAFKYKLKYRFKINIQLHPLRPVLGSKLYEEHKNNLEYDDHGHVDTAYIPKNWSNVIALIKKHPEIFSTFYHIRYNSTHREEDIKFSFIINCLETCFANSLCFAFSVLQDRLIDNIVDKIHQITIPEIISIDETKYFEFGKTLKSFIEMLIEDKETCKLYTIIADIEIYSEELLYYKNSDSSKVLSSEYNPGKLMDLVNNNFGDFNLMDSLKKGKLKNYLMFYDIENKIIKYIEIPNSLIAIK